MRKTAIVRQTSRAQGTRGSTNHSESFKKLGGTPQQNCGEQKPRETTSHSEPSQKWDVTSKLQGT